MRAWLAPLAAFAAPLLVLAAACSSERGNRLPDTAEWALRGAERLELFALDPRPIGGAERGIGLGGSTVLAADGGDFHGYAILGRATVTDPAAAREIALLILDGIAASDGRVAGCFNPRHGVRVGEGEGALDLVICYECLSLQVHGAALGAGVTRANALTSSKVEPAVTTRFERAGLRISEH